MAIDPPNLLDLWFEAMDKHFPGETLDIQPSEISLPTSKAFFYPTFGCPAVIYEVGGNTDRAYVREKARYATTALMELLLAL
jgi:hypothetical protein